MILETEGPFPTGDAVEVTMGKEEIHLFFYKCRTLVQSLCPSVIKCLSITSSHEGFDQKGWDELPCEVRSLWHDRGGQSLLNHDPSYKGVVVICSLAFNKSFSVHRKVFLDLNVGVIFWFRTLLLSWSTVSPRNWAADFVSKSSCMLIPCLIYTVIQYYRLSLRQCEMYCSTDWNCMSTIILTGVCLGLIINIPRKGNGVAN